MRWRSRGGMAEEGELLHYTLLAGWLDWHVSRRGRQNGVGGMTETAPALSTSRTSAISKQEFLHLRPPPASLAFPASRHLSRYHNCPAPYPSTAFMI